MTTAGGRAISQGRIVRFQSEKGLRSAIVVATADDLLEADIDSGATEPITTDGGVHLVWFDHAVKPTHGGSLYEPSTNVAHNVVYAEDTGDGLPVGTWTWPEVR